MSGTFSLATQPILLNIVLNGVFSEAGLKIPIKISGINIYAGMNYSKTQYIAMQCSAVPSISQPIPCQVSSIEQWGTGPNTQPGSVQWVEYSCYSPRISVKARVEQLDPQLGDNGWQESLTLALHQRATRGAATPSLYMLNIVFVIRFIQVW